MNYVFVTLSDWNLSLFNFQSVQSVDKSLFSNRQTINIINWWKTIIVQRWNRHSFFFIPPQNKNPFTTNYLIHNSHNFILKMKMPIDSPKKKKNIICSNDSYRLDMCRRNYPTDVCNRGTAGKFVVFVISQQILLWSKWSMVFIVVYISLFFFIHISHYVSLSVCLCHSLLLLIYSNLWMLLFQCVQVPFILQIPNKHIYPFFSTPDSLNISF